jgi:uncharacterized membrane-anchored protein
MLNKVPEVTIFFWIIKVLGTTIGETAADFLNVNLNLGLRGTSIVTGILLVIALIFQFRAKKYTPAIYWTTVVLISVFGTLVTDNLTDALGVPLQISTIIFSVLLAITLAVWYMSEKTLSIHSIFTRKREAFYWLTILFTFALGTASGDLMAEALGLGYLLTGIIIAATIAAIAIAWRFRLNSILAFWLIYIFTRPLGASIGDLLSQPHKYGGLGLGATMTSFIFLAAILILVVFLTITKKDVTTEETIKASEVQEPERGHVVLQLVVTLLVLLGLGGAGYYFRQSSLAASDVSSVQTTQNNIGTSPSALGDLSSFKTTAQIILDAVNKNDFATANSSTNDLEHDWDTAQSKLKPKNLAAWTAIDNALDKVFREIRAVHPNQVTAKTALVDLQNVLTNP